MAEPGHILKNEVKKKRKCSFENSYVESESSTWNNLHI